MKRCVKGTDGCHQQQNAKKKLRGQCRQPRTARAVISACAVSLLEVWLERLYLKIKLLWTINIIWDRYCYSHITFEAVCIERLSSCLCSHGLAELEWGSKQPEPTAHSRLSDLLWKFAGCQQRKPPHFCLMEVCSPISPSEALCFQ